MIHYGKLKPFTFYRLTSPLVFPAVPDKRRGLMFQIVAPSIDDEIRWIKNENGINPMMANLRLHKYFIEKFTTYKFYRQTQVKITNDPDGELTKTVMSKKIGDIDGITSYKSGVKPTQLKNLNVLTEINHISERVIANPKDTGTQRIKAANLYAAYAHYLSDAYMDEYFTGATYRRYVIIPVDLWLKEDEYSSATTLSSTSKNLFGQLVNEIGRKCTHNVSPFVGSAQLILVNHNEMMILNGPLPEKSGTDFIQKCFRMFLKKCRSFDKIETEQEDADTTEYIQAAAEETQKEELVSATLEKYGVKGTLDPEKEKALVKAVEKTITSAPKIEIPDDIDPEELEDVDPKLFPSEQPESKEDKFKKELDSMMKDAKKTGDMDLVVEARLAGQTVENYRRNKMLREKYSDLKFDGKTFEELAKREEDTKIPDVKLKTTTINDSFNSIKSANFEKTYNEKLMMYDFAAVLMHFANAKPAIYLISDPIIEDISTATDKLVMVTVEYEDENRKRSKFSFKMPKMYQDRYLFLNEQKWNIIHQKVPYPVTKTDPNLCQVSTNYKKIRMSRFGNNISAKITKLKKVLAQKPPRGVIVTPGNAATLNSAANALTTIEYDEIGASIYKLTIGKTRIYFALEDAAVVASGHGIPENVPKTCMPIGITDKNEIIYLDGMTNKVYVGNSSTDHGELSDYLVDLISAIDENFAKDFMDMSAGTKFMYTRAKIMDENIPLVFVLGAADPGGLQAVLDKAKINYEFVDKRPTKLDKVNQGVVPFSDGYLIFDRYPYENSLLLNGLSAYPTKEISFYDLGSRDTYVEIFDSLFNRRTLIDGIENFYYLLIDPITYDVLERLHLPTQFTELLLYANGLLADNTYQIDSDYHQSRLRSNEIINVYLYEALCDAYAAYKYGRAVKFSIREDAVIKALLESPIVDSHSKLNITLELENDRQVKLKGPGGMNVDRALTIEKRAYHPTMQGVIGINSTPSGEVGINRHMSLNSNIIDARGFLDICRGDYDGTEIMTPGELLNTFACESADVERVAMSISQSKHLVPVARSGPSLVNYDMERIAPHLSNDFTFVAKKPGKVVAIDQDIMIIQYDDGSYDDVDLSRKADKNTDGGFYIMNQLETQLKPGDKFDENDVLAFDKKYISPKDAFGDNNANIGTLARVAVVSNGGVFEDACYLTDKLAHDLAAKVTKEKIITVSKYTNVKYMVKKGQEVKANDPLLIFDDTQDEFTSQMLAAMADETDDTDMISATTAPVVTKVSGVVSDIKIYYTVPLEELTPSMQKIIKDYTAKAGAREKFLSKYIDPKNANTIVAPSEPMTPDGTGRVSNIKVGEGVIIKIYVEYLDILGVSDKITNYGALKGVTSFVIPSGQEAYTLNNPERKIDAYLSSIGIYKRMSLDVIKVGGLSKILIEKKRMLRDKYLDKVKSSAKK